jgi:hypothetical protein
MIGGPTSISSEFDIPPEIVAESDSEVFGQMLNVAASSIEGLADLSVLAEWDKGEVPALSSSVSTLEPEERQERRESESLWDALMNDEVQCSSTASPNDYEWTKNFTFSWDMGIASKQDDAMVAIA